MTTLVSLTPLMEPVTYNGQEFAQAIDISKRILGIFDIEELRDLLGEVVGITSTLFKEGDMDLYALFMCLEVRLSNKITVLKSRRTAQSDSEKSMYKLFVKAPEKYIPGAIIVKRKKKQDSQPDFFLEVNGIFSIAEFKATTFRTRHCCQLQEYMKVYKATQGFAVAPQVNCVLPPDIHFVRMFAALGPRI